MPYDARQRRQIAERCWSIYDLMNRNFTPVPEFHLEFPELVELALLVGALQMRITLPRGYALDIQEEYEFRDQDWAVAVYSYVLLDRNQSAILRADPLPHHRVDYRRRKLPRFPHHLHDAHGRIHSFSGQLEDFLVQAATLVRS